MRKGTKLLQVALLILVFAFSAHADIGPKPEISLQLQKNGQPIQENYILCTDSSPPGKQRLFIEEGFKDKKYVEELQSRHEEDKKGYGSCFYSDSEGEVGPRVSFWAYGPPNQIAVIHPVHGSRLFLGTGKEGREDVNPIIYESERIDPKPLRLLGSEYLYKVNINTEDHSIQVSTVREIRIMEWILKFAFLFAATILIELIVAFAYLKYREKSLKPLIAVPFANLFSFPLLTIIPIFIEKVIYMDGPLISLFLGEVLVVPLEVLVIKGINWKRMSWNQAISLALLINLASFLTGEFIYFLLPPTFL